MWFAISETMAEDYDTRELKPISEISGKVLGRAEDSKEHNVIPYTRKEAKFMTYIRDIELIRLDDLPYYAGVWHEYWLGNGVVGDWSRAYSTLLNCVLKNGMQHPRYCLLRHIYTLSAVKLIFDESVDLFFVKAKAMRL